METSTVAGSPGSGASSSARAGSALAATSTSGSATWERCSAAASPACPSAAPSLTASTSGGSCSDSAFRYNARSSSTVSSGRSVVRSASRVCRFSACFSASAHKPLRRVQTHAAFLARVSTAGGSPRARAGKTALWAKDPIAPHRPTIFSHSDGTQDGRSERVTEAAHRIGSRNEAGRSA